MMQLIEYAVAFMFFCFWIADPSEPGCGVFCIVALYAYGGYLRRNG